ncbi:MAG: hypothetical protein JSV05_07660 [Candidatus Bathyarchaeota archaeon]|nr:MAG: hypothetical protein JSV05_07660 [Candidatus Bathyarchaeota archaeon]
MEKVGLLVISYGARATAMIDAFSRSQNYLTKIFVVDKQGNPFNIKKATEHAIIPNLDIKTICKFAARRQKKIDFGIVGPEKPIINGLRDVIEKETDIRMICPTKRFAIESSKVMQRQLFEKVVPSVNPRFKVFNPVDYRSLNEVKRDLYNWLDVLDNQAVVKPDIPAAGKGVGVWGDHFTDRQSLFNHFLANYMHGQVIVEEKIEGEETSFQSFCDGKNLVALPETRDYKRAFDGDTGPNTGGMGAYKGQGDLLPFMKTEDREKEVEIVNKVFNFMKKQGADNELRGMPFYVAFIHSSKGPKILENNSRPGDPEIINVLPLLKDDFTDVCFKMVEGNLTKIEIEKKASVVTYKVPPSYGGYENKFPSEVEVDNIGKPIEIETINETYNLRIYPASLELKEGKIYPLTSRSIATVGIADTIEEARKLSLKGISCIRGGALWNRTDIASRKSIQQSLEHMKKLDQQKQQIPG